MCNGLNVVFRNRISQAFLLQSVQIALILHQQNYEMVHVVLKI